MINSAPLFTPGYALSCLVFAVIAWASATVAKWRWPSLDASEVALWTAVGLCLLRGSFRPWEYHFGKLDILLFFFTTGFGVALLSLIISHLAGRLAMRVMKPGRWQQAMKTWR